MEIDKIKSLYAEFIGYLSQTPNAKEQPIISAQPIWNQYNNSVNRLSEYSGVDYSEFRILPDNDRGYGEYIQAVVYRSKLGGLIAKLHAEYFDSMPEPFSGKPSIIINQTQQQNQQILFQLILDVQSKIDEKLPSLQEGSKERTFFQKLKGSLSATTGIVDLLNKIFVLAKECGVSTDQLMKLFG
jgi:hypothetical protein